MIGRGMGSARGALAQVAHAAVDFLLPPRCPSCGVIVGQQHAFCGACWASIHFLGRPCCASCGLPFAYDLGEGAQCGACQGDPPPFHRARAVMAYGDVARTVALRLKYGRRTGLAELIARHMARHADELGLAGALLVPVPLHRWRLWSRGFNQAALIASALARRTGAVAANDLLLRTRRTPPLRRMSPKQRQRTVRGAFALAAGGRERLRGRHVVLIDDVWTTGATASACAHLIARSGAARVDLLCWARVLPDNGKEAAAPD